MAKRSKPLRWFRLNVDETQPWWVFISHDSISKALVGDSGEQLYGCCVYEHRHIFVNCRYPRTTYAETVVHEIDHLAMESLGLPTFVEEPIVSGTDELKTRLLIQLGFTLPELPDGHSQLVEAMRKRRRKRKK